jgi:membrane protease YdiL (CAAX protease family)
MVVQDNISLTLSAIAVLISIYLATYQTEVVTIYPTILLLTGMVLSRWYQADPSSVAVDRTLEERELWETVKWVVIGVASLVAISYTTDWAFSPARVKLDVAQLSSLDLKLFGVLMAISEEHFFRGFITPYFVSRTSMALGLLLSSMIFATYHFAVYQVDLQALAYVLMAGALLGYMTIQTGRLTPAMLVHIVNNLLAS